MSAYLGLPLVSDLNHTLQTANGYLGKYLSSAAPPLYGCYLPESSPDCLTCMFSSQRPRPTPRVGLITCEVVGYRRRNDVQGLDLGGIDMSRVRVMVWCKTRQ